MKIKGAKLYVVTKNDFCVIGLTKFGISVVEKLLFLNKNVLVIDVDPNKIAQISSTVQAAIILDPTNKDGLEQVGVKDSQNVIIAIDNDLATSIICTEIIKSFGIPNLIVKSINSHHEMILKALNVKNIVNTELEAAEKVLLKLVWELEMEVIPIDKEHSVAHFILANEWWCETNSVEKFCEKYLINIIAIKRNDKFILLERSTELLLNDELFCFANYKQLRIIQKCKNMEEINN